MSTHRKVGTQWILDRSPNPQGNGHTAPPGYVHNSTLVGELEDAQDRVEELEKQRVFLLDQLDEARGMHRGMTPDERNVVRMVSQMVTDKLMGEGRREKGELLFATDARTSQDFLAEAQDELTDGLTYLAMSIIKRGMENEDNGE